MAVPRTLEELNQHPVFSYFLWLCEIPHATFKEKALSNAIYTWAKRHEKWMSWQDTHHNLYIRKPATPGYEAKPALLFQAHLDMVCVAAPGVISPLPLRGTASQRAAGRPWVLMTALAWPLPWLS